MICNNFCGCGCNSCNNGCNNRTITQVVRGPAGPAGPAGADAEPPTLTIGTVTTGEPGTDAAASITGTTPNFELNLTIPQGETGPAGPTGPAGADAEPITLTIGTVTTGAPGSEAAASITGTSPNFVLNLTIPQGPVGPAAG